METLLAFLIASVLTFYFVRRYVKSMAPARSASVPAKPAATGPAGSCPRCGRAVERDAAFCPACGASMALWNVHRAVVQEGAQGETEKGAPRPVINASLCIGCGSCVDVCPESGTLELHAGKAILAHPDRCRGHAKCVEVCPTSALSLAFGNVLQTLRVPLVKENFETNVAGVYIVGELCGMGLIKTAINEGRLVIDTIRKRLEAGGHWRPPEVDHSGAQPAHSAGLGEPYDVIIAGSGPAGLSASLSAHQHGLRYLTIEQGEIAATIRNYPRHKFLMAEPIEMPLYGNLYVGDGTKESLLKVWEAIISNTGISIQTQERVEAVCRQGELLEVSTSRGTYMARHVVLALGKRGTPRRLGVPGEELPKVAYSLIEADSYSGHNILVIGGGDSAIEAALAVSKSGRNHVTLSYRGASFDRARERNRNMLAAAEQEGRLRIERNSHIREIRQDSVVIETARGLAEEPNDFVFILAGGESPEAFLRKTGIEIVEKAISA